ncbi:unnamed protein product [Medioppia subpectinata]|uniref:VASt domain-containing protein n=1 Tax=Medioppia subpectinata TaxID=1979941 RepID=A0A7R9KKK0_9ACAR|nr:unnamed protein product [Medioppia subpectinata]CAG2104105.1 unnamed protein product [Medioppia subpectinata]
MQSMLASQQQLIRRSLNGSNKDMKELSTACNSNESNDPVMNGSNETIDTTASQPSADTSDTSVGVGSDVNVTDVRRSGNKKKRSTNSWLNILNPSYKTRHEEFKRLFSNLVPNNERLVVDYSCALQKEILVHGRLYLSLNYISFYANIFKWETSLVIKCRDITSLTKANTARVIPNAIQVVTTSGDKYVFTSFGARDKTYVMLFRIWQNALLDQPMSSAQLWHWVHYSYGEDLGLTSDDDEEYYSDNLVHTLGPQTEPLNATDSPDSCAFVDTDIMADREVYEDCDDSQTISSTCRCESHDGKLIIDETLPVSVDRAFELLFTDNKFIHALHKSRRTYDLKLTQWEDSDKDKCRQLTYTVALNHALVKSARTVECQRLMADSTAGKYYTIKAEVVNEGIPYCDTFLMQSLWCLTQDAEEVTRMKVHAKVVFRKNVWGLALMKSTIEKNSIQGISDFSADLSKQLPQWVQMERNLDCCATVNQITHRKIDDQNSDYNMSVNASISPISTSIQSSVQNRINDEL